jgi:Flp pilus assembly pilin Flp
MSPTTTVLPSRQGILIKLEGKMFNKLICTLWSDDAGQDIAEYAVMLAVILVLVVGTVRLIGSNANNIFSATASSIQ